MDEISKLLQEAKPLYLARKKRNNRIKSGVLSVVCVLILSGLYPKPSYQPDLENLESDVYLTESGSVIENMGLPTDEYGLLMVG